MLAVLENLMQSININEIWDYATETFRKKNSAGKNNSRFSCNAICDTANTTRQEKTLLIELNLNVQLITEKK